MSYLSRETLLRAVCDLAERDYIHPTLSAPLRIRELSASQVVEMRDAAKNEVGAIDGSLWRALTIVQGVIDGPGGAPMLTIDDVGALTSARYGLTEDLSTAIWALSEARPADLKPRSSD